LQTSQKLFDYFDANPLAKDSDLRHVLVRMIPATSVDIHDSIIRATNRQTSIPAAYLWATAQIHRDIETIFSGAGLYYDRRKNSWRRENIPFENVVGMTELAQCVASILRQEPDHARARPARYFNSANHGQIFSQRYIHAYVICARIKKKAALFLRRAETERSHRTNLLFYLVMASVCVALRTAKPNHQSVSKLNLVKMDDQLFEQALAVVRPIYVKHGESDKAAKGTAFAADLRAEFVRVYPFKKRARK
jgi:AIPR protein